MGDSSFSHDLRPDDVHQQRLDEARLSHNLPAVDAIEHQYVDDGPYAKPLYRSSAIIEDAIRTDDVEFVARFIPYGLDVLRFDVCIMNARADRCFQLLVQRGYDINELRGTRLPRFAECNVTQDVLFWLLDHGANFNLSGAMSIASFMSRIVEDCSPELIEKVLSYPGRPDHPDHPSHAIDVCQGDLLIIVLWRRETDVVRTLNLLLDHGAPLNEGLYHRHQGARRMHFSVSCGSPLCEAAGSNRMDAVQCLLARGAHVWFRDNKGQTALDYAEKKGHGDIARVLREAMRNTDAKMGIQPS